MLQVACDKERIAALNLTKYKQRTGPSRGVLVFVYMAP